MKKLLICVLAVVMLLSLCACGGELNLGGSEEPQDDRVALDVFAGLKVSFPASINGSGKKCNLDYDVSQVEYDRSNADIRAFLEGVTFYTDELSGLSNGDTVTVYASWSQSTADALGVKLQETSKEYTVSGLYDVYRSAEEVPAELDELDQIMEAMESAIRRAWTMQYEHYEDCEESYRYYYAYSNDADGNAYSPAWLTLNLRASLQLARGLSLNATLENIADKRYRPYSCGISAPGRNITMSLSYKF